MPEIFDTRGEAEFRRIETDIIRQHVAWIERGPARGVGAGRRRLRRPANRELMAETGSACGSIVLLRP